MLKRSGRGEYADFLSPYIFGHIAAVDGDGLVELCGGAGGPEQHCGGGVPCD